MANTYTRKMKLRLLVDAGGSKVLFAEVGKEFVDFLVSIMPMQVAPVARLLGRDRLAGSLGELYGSLEALDINNWLPNIDRTQVFRPPAPSNYPMLQSSLFMLRYDGLPAGTAAGGAGRPVGGGAGYVVGGGVSYMVTDELVVTPLSMESVVKVLKKVKDNAALQHREVEFGNEEATDLLKNLLSSKSVLTKVFLDKKKL